MYRYCAFVPKPGREAEAAPLIAAYAAQLGQRTPPYEPIAQGTTLTVLAAPDGGTALRAFPLPSGGAVLGTLFADGTATPVAQIGDTEAARLSARPEALHRLFWGRYVAFLPGPEGVAVVRDPTGGLDCFHVEHPQFHCFFCDAADMAEAGLIPPGIDWRHVARHLHMPARELDDTGLEHVRTLRGGTLLEVTREGSAVRRFWRPEESAARDPPASPEAASEMLRAAVLQAVHGWGAVYGRILMSLSGGLDSAIVLACLDGAISPDDVLCINYRSGTADSDERIYARLASAHFQADLMELDERPEAVRLQDVQSIRFSAQPALVLAQLVRSARQARMARTFEARAVFDGNGGDEIFGSLLYLASAADYLCTRGFDRGFLVAAHDAARLARLSVWRVVRDAMAHARRGGAPLPPPGMDAAFAAHMRAIFPGFEEAMAAEATHPPALDLPPAKRLLINATALANRHWYPDQDRYDVETVHPLISQPVLEAIYPIPAHMFSLGGLQRGLARHAFRSLVPPEILRRLTKGGIDTFTDRIVTHNLGFLRDYFLDGLLVRQGLLNRRAVEQAFQPDGGPNRLMRTTLLSALGAEAWARQWAAMPARPTGPPPPSSPAAA